MRHFRGIDINPEDLRLPMNPGLIDTVRGFIQKLRTPGARRPALNQIARAAASLTMVGVMAGTAVAATHKEPFNIAHTGVALTTSEQSYQVNQAFAAAAREEKMPQSNIGRIAHYAPYSFGANVRIPPPPQSSDPNIFIVASTAPRHSR